MFCKAHVAISRIFIRRVGIVAVGLALTAASSCSARTSGKGLLPPPDPVAITPAPNQPERPFNAQDDVFSRPVYRTEQAVPFRVEILDLLIPPGKATSLKHEAVVVVETREGTGAAMLQEKRTPLGAGAVFGLSQGEAARIENGGKEPLLLRVHIVTTR